MKKEAFKDWEVPKWHSDMGDPNAEFRLLKSFCTDAQKISSLLEFQLDNFEEGYMCVLLFFGNKKVAELHVSDINTKELSLFSSIESKNNHEVIFNNFKCGKEFISRLI